MANTNELYLPQGPIASGYIDYYLRSIPNRVEPVRPNQLIAFTGGDAVVPAIDSTGDLVLTSTSAGQTIKIPFMDLRPKGYVLQATTAAKKKVQIDISAVNCNPNGHRFDISVERYETTDAYPKIEVYTYYFDESCTFSDAEKIAKIINEVNTRPNGDVVATANGTTGIFLEAVTAGVSFEATAGGGLVFNQQTVANQVAFGTGQSLVNMGFSPTGITLASTYKIIVIRYWKPIDFALLGMQRSQKDENGTKVMMPQTAWCAFETTGATQDSNYTALTAVLFPSELRFRRLSSLTAVN